MNPDTHHRLTHALMALHAIANDCEAFLQGHVAYEDHEDFVALIRDFAFRQHKQLSSEQ